VVLKEGSVAKAVMASTCIPGVFVPVEFGDRLLVDGGIVENVPVTPLQSMGADTIIGVDLNAGYPRRKPKNIIEVLLRSFELTLKTATKMQAEKADVLIEPDLSSFNMVDITQKEELMERGYQQAMDVLKG
jgi:NTE family protein